MKFRSLLQNVRSTLHFKAQDYATGQFGKNHLGDLDNYLHRSQVGRTFLCHEGRQGMTINFKNLIVGRHESKVLFMWDPKEGAAMLGAFLGIKDGIEAILARDGITPAQRVTLEEF